jgi:geranylgeranylglycerol-phosphate geranylgeranyltransferase
MIGLAVIIGEVIAIGGFPGFYQALLGFFSAFLLLAGTMVLNDIHDVEVDRINTPNRPIPSGRVKISQAYALVIILSLCGIISSVFLGWETFLIALLALGLMVFYNFRGKETGLLGNMVVSFNIALPFVFGGFAVNSLRPLLFVFSIIAFLANMGREVAKGIMDVTGDRIKNVRTLAVLRGPRIAGIVAAGFFVIAVVMSFLTPFLQSVSVWYYPLVIIADLGFVYSSYRLVKNQASSNIHSVKTQVLLWMLFGLVGFLAGGVAG